ncbi:MAG TPA: 16S rRNA (cytosine(1402)-N(4))-methyltransferase, partial [Croceibacterium sp.]
LAELEAALRAAEHLLREDGRLAVVSFHSLEDRIVKQFLREAAGAVARTSRHLPEVEAGPEPTFAGLAKAVRPSDAEALRNPRARSATLRAAIRTAAPARQHQGEAA